MRDAYWLVIDAPYVQLKLWPLNLGEDKEGKKTVSLSVDAWRLEVPRYWFVFGNKKSLVQHRSKSLSKFSTLFSRLAFPSRFGQAVVLEDPLSASIAPYHVQMSSSADAHAVELILSTLQPLVNFALENYAHRVLAFAQCPNWTLKVPLAIFKCLRAPPLLGTCLCFVDSAMWREQWV